MPEEPDAVSEEAATEPKVRRISNKNPRKTAKVPKPEPEDSTEVPNEEFDPSPPAASDGALPPSETPGGAKRKNRRRRGKGKSKDEESTAGTKAEQPPEQPEPQDSPLQRAPHVPQPQKPRRKLDSEKVAKNAWKIFLAEVSEEGVALIGDNDARELARRCFRLSEIFLEEEARRN